MAETPNLQDASPQGLERAYSWLAPIWLFYVLAAFFTIRILGSGMAQRFISLAKVKFGR